MRLTNHETLLVAKNIAEVIHTLVDSNKYNVSIDWKEYYNDGVDPFNSQTDCGLFLEEYNGMPCYLYTPIGRWKIMDRTTAKGNQWNMIMKDLKKRLQLELFISRRKITKGWVGYIGPVWKIISFDNKILPEPIMKSKSNLCSSSYSREVFKKFIEEYPLIT